MFRAIRDFARELRRGMDVMYGDQGRKRESFLHRVHRKVKIYGRRRS